MKIDLYDTKEFIKVNSLQEVSNPVLFLRNNIPSPDGLLSTDIFGVAVNERKNTFAYIDLHGYFLHPFIYKIIKRMNRNFEHIVHCTRKYRIEKGQLIEDEENGETGIRFLYDNWEKINFEKNNSLARNERIDAITSYKKNVLFTHYWIVIPPFFRDVNLQAASKGIVSHHEINDKYSKLIRLTSTLNVDSTFDIVLNTTNSKIQDTLVEIYDMIKSKIEKKHGMIRKNLLGKSVDYGSRLVISAPTFHANTYDEMVVDFYHSGIPLAQCCSLFTPFIVGWVKNFFRREFEKSGNKYPHMNKDGNIDFVELDSPEMYFTDDYIKKEINRFIRSYGDRFDPIEIPVKGMTGVRMRFNGYFYDKNNPGAESTIISRDATWCDILYQAAVDVTADKMIYITRYPLAEYFNIFPTQVHVLSTSHTVPVQIDGRVYTHYPDVDLNKSKSEVAISFLDTVTMSNLYLKGMNGDYDGDQISVKGVFTQEANEEARRIMMSKAHILTVCGDSIRTTGTEGIQTLYTLTKFA